MNFLQILEVLANFIGFPMEESIILEVALELESLE
jgi:hypothetical protein